jgi:holo-[acyl-carrier protein] synthase
MDVLGHGVDIVEVGHFQSMCDNESGGRFLERCFTPAELTLAGEGPNRAQRLAGRFAAKEAVLKALGTGFSQGISFIDIEIGALPSGAPTVAVYMRAAELASTLGIVSWLVSISHTPAFAVASVIALSSRAAS